MNLIELPEMHKYQSILGITDSSLLLKFNYNSCYF